MGERGTNERGGERGGREENGRRGLCVCDMSEDGVGYRKNRGGGSGSIKGSDKGG